MHSSNMRIDGIALPSSKQYNIAWTAPLTCDLAAASAMLDQEHAPPSDFHPNPHDKNSYTWGRMGEHNIVITTLPAGLHGTAAAAMTASRLAASLPHIDTCVLVGGAGAIPKINTVKDENGADVEYIDERRDIRLGDVVVSRPDEATGGVVQYDIGKAKKGRTWQRTGHLNAPPHELLGALRKVQATHCRGRSKMPMLLAEMWERNPHMAAASYASSPSFTHQGVENDKLFKSAYSHADDDRDCEGCCSPAQQVIRPPRDTTDPKVHLGVIASGSTFVRDSFTRSKLAASTGADCHCYETEAAGVMLQFPCLVIRGIHNYADCHKSDRWQPYASATAAACAKEILLHVTPKKWEPTFSWSDIFFCKSPSLPEIRSPPLSGAEALPVLTNLQYPKLFVM